MFSMHRRTPDRFASLRTIPMFCDLSDSELLRLDAQTVEIDIPAGKVLIREGDSGREAFIVVDGIAEIQVEGDLVGLATGGDLVGEIALLTGVARTATVTALTAMRARVMDPSQFTELFTYPRPAHSIAAQLAQRLAAIRSATDTAAPAR